MKYFKNMIYGNFSLQLNVFELQKVQDLIAKENICQLNATQFKVIFERLEDCDAIESLLGWHD